MKYIGLSSSKVYGIKVLPFYLLTFLLFSLTGCIEEFEAEVPEDESNLLVVEGTIYSGKQCTFTLSWTDPINGYAEPRWSTEAQISVRGTDGSVYETEGGYGKYTCQLGDLNPDVEYYLHIEVDGDVYESDPQKPLRTEKIADVRGVQESQESDINILLTPAEPFDNSKTNYYSWTYDETWEVRPEYTTVIAFVPQGIDKGECVVTGNLWPERGWKDQASETVMIGSSNSYEGQHIQQMKLYEVDHSSQRMFYKYSSLIHQRAISKGEYEYEKARMQASEDMGGLFTPQPSALPSNIHCKTSKKRAIGYIGCSLNTSEYRLFLVDKDFYIERPRKKSDLVVVDEPTVTDCIKLVNNGLYLVDWNDERYMGGILQTTWAYRYQLDVTIYGCYTEKPDYWDSTENISY